jgi:hypothetical protein
MHYAGGIKRGRAQEEKRGEAKAALVSPQRPSRKHPRLRSARAWQLTRRRLVSSRGCAYRILGTGGTPEGCAKIRP